MLLQLALPADAVALFGGMKEIVLNVTVAADDEVELTLSWTGKTPTRLAESSWLSFNPSLPKPATKNDGWKLDVMVRLSRSDTLGSSWALKAKASYSVWG